MGLTRDFRETVVERVRNDPEFANALLDEAVTLFLNGEPRLARLICTISGTRKSVLKDGLRKR